MKITKNIEEILKNYLKQKIKFDNIKEFMEIYRILKIIECSFLYNEKILFIDFFSWNWLISYFLQKFYKNSLIIPTDIIRPTITTDNKLLKFIKILDPLLDIESIEKIKSNYIKKDFILERKYFIDFIKKSEYTKIVLIWNHGCKHLSLNLIKLINELNKEKLNKEIYYIIQPCCTLKTKTENFYYQFLNKKIIFFSYQNMLFYMYYNINTLIENFLKYKLNFDNWYSELKKNIFNLDFWKIKWLYLDHHNYINRINFLVSNIEKKRLKLFVSFTYKNIIIQNIIK